MAGALKAHTHTHKYSKATVLTTDHLHGKSQEHNAHLANMNGMAESVKLARVDTRSQSLAYTLTTQIHSQVQLHLTLLQVKGVHWQRVAGQPKPQAKGTQNRDNSKMHTHM